MVSIFSAFLVILPLELLLETMNLSGMLLLGFLIPGFICLAAFMGSLYGMSNEIVSSGDYLIL